MSTITNLNVNLLAHTSKFDGPVKKSSSIFGGLSGTLSKMPGPAAIAQGAVAGVTAVAGTAAAGVAVLASKISSLSKEIQDFERFGLSAEDSLGQFKVMAAGAGLELEDLADLTKDLSVRIGEANLDGQGETFDLFSRLGLDVKALAAMSPEKQLESYATAISKVDNATERLAITDILLSDAGTKALGMLEKGTAGFTDAAKQADKFGLNVSAVDSAQLMIAKEAINKISLLTEGLWTQFSVQGAPMLKAITDMFLEGMDSAGGMSNVVETGFSIITAGIGFALDGWNLFMSAWHAGQATTTAVVAHTLQGIADIEQALVAVGGKSFDFGIQAMATAAWDTAGDLAKQSAKEFDAGINGVASADFEKRMAEIRKNGVDRAKAETSSITNAPIKPIDPVEVKKPEPVKGDDSLWKGLAAIGKSIFDTTSSFFEATDRPDDAAMASGLARYSSAAQSMVNQLNRPTPKVAPLKVEMPGAGFWDGLLTAGKSVADSIGESVSSETFQPARAEPTVTNVAVESTAAKTLTPPPERDGSIKDQLARNNEEQSGLLQDIANASRDLVSEFQKGSGVIVGLDG